MTGNRVTRAPDALSVKQFQQLQRFSDVGGHVKGVELAARIVGEKGLKFEAGRSRLHILVREGIIDRVGKGARASFTLTDKGRAVLEAGAPDKRQRRASYPGEYSSGDPADRGPDVLRPCEGPLLAYPVESMAVTLTAKFQCHAPLSTVRGIMAEFFADRSANYARHVRELASHLAGFSFFSMGEVELERVLHEGLRRAVQEVAA